jgi:hypothetical protein
MSLESIRTIAFPKIEDPRGNLTFLQQIEHIPFIIKRVYWIYDVPGGQHRGGHAYQTLEEVFIALSGSFDVVLDDGFNKKTFSLNRSYYGLYVPNMIWRSLENFSTNSLCLIIASDIYYKHDYIRDYEFYKKLVSNENY